MRERDKNTEGEGTRRFTNVAQARRGRGLCVIGAGGAAVGVELLRERKVGAAELCVGRVWRYAKRTVVSGVVVHRSGVQRAACVVAVGGLQDVKFAHTDVCSSPKHANHSKKKSHTEEIQSCST